MKKLIAELPTLTAPTKKEELIVYLAVAREAMSAVLMTEREAKQMLIYFVSRALQGDGGLDGISRGVIGDNERVISNGEMVWIDVVFDGALGALGEEEVVMGEGVVVTSSSLVESN
ncbi:hypothetical protein Tco_1316974 [Tanacetum coccineum]